MLNILTCMILILTTTLPAMAEEPTALESDKDKASYALGLDMGSGLKRQNIDLNEDLFAAGILDALKGRTPKLSDLEARDALLSFQREFRKQESKRLIVAAATNKKAGQQFLAENKKKDGVITLDSGLQYEVIKEGTGSKPYASDTVRVHYHGTLLNGEVFDSSVERNEPVSFPLNRVIAGWTEGIQLMNVGSKHRLFIPSKLAYKEKGRGPTIGPNATLIFEVELLGIE